MSLEVIGAGFGRTGTYSLKLALEQLGFTACHHMESVFSDPNQLPYWQAAVAGEPVDWEQAFQGCAAAIDWPSTHYWRQLVEAYPDAKVLLSVRPLDRWWLSFSQTIKRLLSEYQVHVTGYHREVLDMANEMIVNQTFSGSLDEQVVCQAYQERVAAVQRELPSERLLVFDVAEGWEPLCRFLERPVPATDFPRTNSKNEFWKIFGAQFPPQT